MKKNILPILVVCLLFISCTKEQTHSETYYKLIGKWELMDYLYNFKGDLVFSEDTDESYIEFREDGSFINPYNGVGDFHVEGDVLHITRKNNPMVGIGMDKYHQASSYKIVTCSNQSLVLENIYGFSTFNEVVDTLHFRDTDIYQTIDEEYYYLLNKTTKIPCYYLLDENQNIVFFDTMQHQYQKFL